MRRPVDWFAVFWWAFILLICAAFVIGVSELVNKVTT